MIRLASPKIIGAILALVIISAVAGILATSVGADLSPTRAAEKDRLAVITSVAPITNIVKNVGGDRIQLQGLVPEGVNSHTFQLTPSASIMVANADLVIINGLNLEIDFERAVEAAGRSDLQLLKLADNTITRDQWVFDFSFPERAGDPNPHLWLNVAYSMKYVELVRDKLAEVDPENADYYNSNAASYLDLLRRLDQGIMDSVLTVPEENRKLLTYHDSWAYFAPRYGMAVIGAVQPSHFGEPTPQEVARIIDQIRQERVPAIFASEVFNSRVVDQIAREANVEIVETLSDDALPGNVGDPEHTYVGMMLENMLNMLIPLGGNVDPLAEIDPADTYQREL